MGPAQCHLQLSPGAAVLQGLRMGAWAVTMEARDHGRLGLTSSGSKIRGSVNFPYHYLTLVNIIGDKFVGVFVRMMPSVDGRFGCCKNVVIFPTFATIRFHTAPVSTQALVSPGHCSVV
jgi:hypothetical protein